MLILFLFGYINQGSKHIPHFIQSVGLDINQNHPGFTCAGDDKQWVTPDEATFFNKLQ